ncbi:hypothetical protein [Dyella sp. 2RAB6]|uniref:hypothetical protein n=1 Tax=Dyella sp. 2RAB6 TaxID=3232992 RepID=UPI003F8F487A
MKEPGDGVVRLAISGDIERGQGYVPLALGLLYRTQERMRVGSLAQLSAQARFDADAYGYVVIAGGINAVHIVAGAGPATEVEDLSEQLVEVPDFLSGTVQNGYIATVPAEPPRPAYETLASFHPTTSCAARFKLEPVYQSVRRLAVKPNDDLRSELDNPSDSSPLVFSQYTRLKPTMFSGTMRHLVQVLMGFGRQARKAGKPTSIYEQTKPRRDGATAPQPTAYQRRVARDGLQIRFDWRFSRTHGITYAADGRPWLVEIGITQGILATPLALNPNTTSAAFRKRIEDKADEEALDILDRYGGFPTGEGFPPTEQLEAWIRAGRVLRLQSHDDLQPFYAHSSYSSQLGWAFNARGDEAHITAWRYGDDDVQRGVHYMVPLQIGAIVPVKPAAGVNGLRRAFGKLTGVAYKDRLPAALWKLDRLSDFEARWARAALARSVDEAFTYVDGLVLDPLASASAHLSKVSEGALWYPPRARLEVGYVARFPEPLIGLLVAHSMKPASDTAPAPARCDTTIHVYFDGNEMKWVKFFQDNSAGAPGGSDDDFEPCMYIGNWPAHSDGGALRVPSMFYTNDLDDRAELATTTSDTRIHGDDLGYCAITCNDSIVNPSVGTARRRKRFRLTTETNTVYSPSLSTGMAVPFYEREAYYYAVQHADQGRMRTVTAQHVELTDPWYCNYKRNFPGYYGQYAGSGTPEDPWRPVHLLDVNGYGPNEYRTADPDSPLYDDGAPCADVADSGPWVQGGDNLDVMAYSIPEPPLPAPVIQSSPPSGHYDVFLVASGGIGVSRVASVDSSDFGFWPLFTPDSQDGGSADQYAEASQNAAGRATSLRSSSNLNGALRIFGWPAWPGMEHGYLTYIGVIHG